MRFGERTRSGTRVTTWSQRSVAANAYGTATGGIGAPTSVTISGVNYQYLQFNATGTLTVTKAGFFDFLLVGGGGAGGRTTYGAGGNSAGFNYTGGGGGGGVVVATVYLDANVTITVGGTASHTYVSTEQTLCAVPGGSGGGGFTFDWQSTYFGYSFRRDGGCGGADTGTMVGSGATGFQGFDGGNSNSNSSGGGGGGGSANGSNGNSGTGGAGGTGYDISTFIGGSTSRVAGGGGGSGSSSSGAGGSGGGGDGSSGTGTNGTVNTGGGGGGSSIQNGPSQGGSGIAYVRWKV